MYKTKRRLDESYKTLTSTNSSILHTVEANKETPNPLMRVVVETKIVREKMRLRVTIRDLKIYLPSLPAISVSQRGWLTTISQDSLS